MRAKLTVTAGPHAGREFDFAGHDTFLVGRSAKAHFRLDDAYFSRVHFLVEVNPPRCRLVDMGSRNGTRVNGTRVAEADLSHGDVIKAGHTELRFEVAANGRDTAGLTLTDPGEPQTATHAEAQGDGVERAAIPDYELGELIGRGGMGVVYRARRLTDGATVAVKTIVPALAASPSMVGRFLREASILRELDHPRIVRFLDLGEAAGVLYFVMEYVAGTDFAKLLKERGPLPVTRAVRVALQLLAALEYAHCRGFVHRDVKPSNVLLEEGRGGKRAIKVADFGLARAYDASQLSGLTLTGDVGGTVDYMPPEQVSNFRDVSPAADQFSAAATLYRLLTNESLYDQMRSGHPLGKVLEGSIVPLRERLPDVPAGLADAVGRALARDPAARFPDVKAFRAALLSFGR